MATVSNAKWALIQHVPYEGPGLIAEVAAAHGVEFVKVRGYADDPMPDWREIGGVVSMGGPMSVHDAGHMPFLEAEMGLLWVAVDQDLPVLGVCLGAQLLAAGLGAEVRTGKKAEVGVGEVTLTHEGETDAVLGPAGENVPVLHWHQDTFEIPKPGVRLASSGAYRNQAYRIGKKVYGFQFHVELTPELADSCRPHLPEWVEMGAEDVARIGATGKDILDRFFTVARAGG